MTKGSHLYNSLNKSWDMARCMVPSRFRLRTRWQAVGGKEMTERLIDLAGILRHETDKGLLIDFGEAKPVWLPKARVEDNGDGTFTMPEWLAIDKELI